MFNCEQAIVRSGIGCCEIAEHHLHTFQLVVHQPITDVVQQEPYGMEPERLSVM